MMSFLVTVGICVRNGQSLLPKAVDSILSQNFPQEKIQVIFVDDGSTDQTPQIISHYLKILGGRGKAFKSTCVGMGDARNLIVNATDGKYLLFVDADEILMPNYMKDQIDLLEKNPDVGVTAGIFKMVPGNVILNLEITPYIVNQINFGQSKSLFLGNDKLMGTGGTAFRTQAIRQVNGFDESIHGAGEDLNLIIRIRDAGWKIKPNKSEFYELHSGLSKPKDLWRKYYWYGYSTHKSFQQIRHVFSLPFMTPPAGVVTGVFYSMSAYRAVHKKEVFLLPLHFGFKLTAWVLGFMKGQLHR